MRESAQIIRFARWPVQPFGNLRRRLTTWHHPRVARLRISRALRALSAAGACAAVALAGRPGAAEAPEGGARGGDAGLATTRQYKVVLVAGDSMVGFRCCLSNALEERFRAEGARVVSDAWNNVQTATYDRDARLPALLRRVNPDLVLVSLGTNDVFVPHPEALAANVASIARKIAPRDCYWIGPPTWTKDTGIVDVIRKHAAPCRFYDSSGLPLERLKDGVHVTDAGGRAWAEHFWRAFRGGV